MNVENLHAYDFTAYTIVSHVLTLGYAAMAAGLLYFLVSSMQLRSRYRLTSYLSAVVMVSAFLQLLVLSLQWDATFVREPGGDVFAAADDQLFSNGFRYMNWSIDVPVLLLQLLVALGVTGAAFRRGWILFTVAGFAMIYTGYAGQYFEVDRGWPFWFWGAVSTVFYVVIVVLVYRVVHGNLPRLPREVHGLTKGVFWLLVISWTLYPGGYLMPVFADSAEGVVARQITWTFADITSKVIYGVMLGLIAQKLSALEGFREAQQSQMTEMRGGITDVGAPGRT